MGHGFAPHVHPTARAVEEGPLAPRARPRVHPAPLQEGLELPCEADPRVRRPRGARGFGVELRHAQDQLLGPERCRRLAACVEFGEDYFECRHLVFGVLANRNAAPVIDDLDRLVTMEYDLDLVREAASGFVDTVVDEFPHQVDEALASGASDVHARPFADGLEAFERLNCSCVVCGVRSHGGGCFR